MDIVESAVTSEEANQQPQPPPHPPPPSTTKSFTALSPKRKKNNNNSRTPSPTKLIEAAVKSANYSGEFFCGEMFWFFYTIRGKNRDKSFVLLKNDVRH